MLPLLLSCLCTCASGPPRDDRLSGRWVLDDLSCAEDGLVFRADGTWSTVREGGRWSLRGDKLTLRLGYHVNFTDGRHQAAAPNLCHSERIAWVGANRLETHWEDRTVHRLSRCPSERQPSSFCAGDCAALTPFDDGGWANRRPAGRRQC